MMDLLRRIVPGARGDEEKAATDLRARRSVLGFFAPKVTWTPRNHEKFAREGYRNTVWVYACVQEVVRAVRSIPPVLYRDRRGGEVEEIGDHPLLDLLRKPNRLTTWPDLAESLAAYTLTTGNRYLVGMADGERISSPTARPKRLFTLAPPMVKIDAENGDRFAYSIKYGTDASKAETFRPGEYWHGKTWNPLSEFYGLGAIEAAWRGVDFWNAAMSHNTALLQNGARPSGAWVTEETLTEEQFRRMQSQMQAYEGAANAGKNLLLEGGVTWQEHAVSPRDLDYLAGLGDATRQIHAAFGVHPVLTGAETGTFENQEKALRKLYVQAAIPLVEAILTDLNLWLAPRFGEGLRLGVDRDRIDALSEDLDSLWKRTREAYVSGILTREESRLALGYSEEAEGTMYLDDRPSIGFAAGGPAEGKATPRSSTLRDAQWKAHDERLTRAEGRVRKAARRAFRRELGDVLDAIDGLDPSEVGAAAARAITGDHLSEGLNEALLAIAIDAGRAMRADLKLGPGPEERREFEILFGTLFDSVLGFVQDQGARAVKYVDETTKAQVATEVLEGVEAGEGAYQIRDRIETLYLDQIIPNRSEVIARTESVKAYNFGAYTAARGSGLKLSKSWIATRDDRTREAHIRADGQTVALEARFDVGGDRLEYPGDPSGRPENIIQCRCAVAYEVEE